MKRTKNILVLLAVAAFACAFAGGCGKPDDPKQTPEEQQMRQQKKDG